MPDAPARYEITKTYPPRGSLQQCRLTASTSFTCFRCGSVKTSKLVTVYDSSWERLLCNGCYGRLLSLYEVKAGTADNAESAAALAEYLLTLVPLAEVKLQEADILRREEAASLLQPQSLRSLATAESVAAHLRAQTDLDWSAAIIGLAKACEVELVTRLIDPLKVAVGGEQLVSELQDKDFGRIARYCAGRSSTPPEIGSIAHLLQTAANSQSRRESSVLLRKLFELARRWPGSDWLFEPAGASVSLTRLTSDFRNPAVHLGEVTGSDFAAASDLVVGSGSLLWKIVTST